MIQHTCVCVCTCEREISEIYKEDVQRGRAEREKREKKRKEEREREEKKREEIDHYLPEIVQMSPSFLP